MAAKPSTKKAKVLLVDDEEIILDMYALKFKKCGYDTFITKSAREGLAIAEKEAPDIIFTDIVMPDKDGFWFLKKIKTHRDPKISSIPVVMLTNMDDPDSRRKCTELGCLYFFVKPLHTPAELAEIIKNVLEVKRK